MTVKAALILSLAVMAVAASIISRHSPHDGWIFQVGVFFLFVSFLAATTTVVVVAARRLKARIARLKSEATTASVREYISLYGEITTDGARLTYTTRRKTWSVHADEVTEIQYSANPFGAMHANAWCVVHNAGGKREFDDVPEYDHLTNPLFDWCEKYLSGFDREQVASFSRATDGTEENDVAWTRSGGSRRAK